MVHKTVIRVQTMENYIVVDLFFTITLNVLTSISVEVSRKIARERKRKTNRATITSFPRSVLSSNIALDQSAGEKSLSYIKRIHSTNNYCFVVDSSRLHLTFTTFGRLFIIREQYNYWLRRSIIAPDQIPDTLYVISVKCLSLTSLPRNIPIGKVRGERAVFVG